MQKTDRVNIYGQDSLAMQIRLETDDTENRNTLVVENKGNKDINVTMDNNKKCYIDVQNIDVAKPVSQLGLVVAQESGKTHLDKYSKDPTVRMNVLDMLSQAHKDIENSNFDNVVKAVTHNADLEMNDIQPFNDVGFHGAENEGTIDHKGFDTWQIPLQGEIIMNTENIQLINNTIKALNNDATIDALATPLASEARAKTMKPFISFDQNSDDSVANAYITVNFDDSDSSQTTVETDLTTLNEIFSSSLIKLSALQGTFEAKHHKKGMGLPAPHKIGTNTLYKSVISDDDSISSEANTYLKLWYNFVSQQLVTLNAYAMSEHYNITNGLLPLLTDAEIEADNVEINGWDIILIDNTGNNATTLFNDLEYSQNISNWQIANYIRGDTSTLFKLKTSKIHASNNARQNDTLEVGGEVVNYPSNSFVWNLSDQYVWVDEFGNVSEPVASAADANIHLKRYIVKWNNGMPSSSHLKSEDGGAVFKVNVNTEYDGNMEVELISHVNDTSYDGTTNPKKFSNIRNRKFPKANYDHLDDIDKVPMIRVQVNGFPTSSTPSDKSLYWLSMSQNHRFGNIIHEASKEILADSKYVHDAVSHLVDYSNATANNSSLTQDRSLTVEKLTDEEGNITSVNDALDKFANGAVSGSKSNAVWFYEKSASQSTLTVQSAPEVNGDGFGFGFISVGHSNTSTDYNIPVHSDTLEYRYVLVTSYNFNEVQDTWNVILDEDSNSTTANERESLLTIVNQYPYRFAKSSTAHFFKIEYPDDDTIPLIWLIPCKYTGTSTSIVVSYQNGSVLSTGGISDWTLPSGPQAASLSNYIFNDPSGGTSTARSERIVKLLSGINKHQSGDPTDDSYDNSVAEYDNQTPLTAIQIDNMSTSSGGGGVSYYAMFLNQHIDENNRKLYVSYQIQPTQDQLLGTNGVTPLHIYKNIPASSNEADPSNSVYIIEDITDSNTAGGTSLIAADGTIDFDSASNLFIKCSQYDIDNKQLKTPVSVELTSNVLTVGATQTTVQSTLSLSTELQTLQAYIDSLTGDSIRNLSTVKECEIDTDGNETLTPWSSTGQYSSNPSSDSAYSRLLYLYNQLNLHLDDSKQNTLFDLAVDIYNIDTKWADEISKPDINDYKRATNNQLLKNFSKTGEKLFDNSFDPHTQFDPNHPGYNSGQLFAIESENLLSTCQDVSSQLIQKTMHLHDLLVKGHDNNQDNDAWDTGDTLGYLWLQEKFSDFMTVMEEVTKSQMESWIELSISAANSGTNMSLQNILEEFKSKINNIISNFMNTYNVFIAYLYEEYEKYLKLLEQHHDNIIFHDTLAKGIENIALDNGQDPNVVAYDPDAIPSGFTNGGFFKSNSTDDWITSSTQVDIASTPVDLTNNFSVGANEVTELTVSDMQSMTSAQWVNKYKLLEPTDSIMEDFINDLNLTTGDAPSYNISVKASLTENGLINATPGTTLSNFKYLQVTFTDNAPEPSLPEKIYVLLSITATYHNNLYKVTLSNNVVSVNDAQDVTIDGNTYKVVGNTSRSTSFVVFSNTDISDTGVSIDLLSHLNTSSVDTAAVQGNISCDIEKYETPFSFPNDDAVAFNNMSSQYLTCCNNTNNDTIMNTKWNDTNNVFNVTGRYSSIVIDPTVGANAIQTAVDQDLTAVQSTIEPLTSIQNYETTQRGVIDTTTPGLDQNGDIAPRDEATSIEIQTHDNNEMNHPEAKAFSDMVSDGLNATIVAIHIVFPTDDIMNYDQTQHHPDTIKIGYTSDTVTAPVDVNKQNNRSVYTLDTSGSTLTTDTIKSIQYELGSRINFAVILETTQNNVTTLYTLVGKFYLRNEFMPFMPVSQNDPTLDGTGEVDLEENYRSQTTTSTIVSAYVIPRLSAILYTQDDSTPNVNFQTMLNLDVTNESDIATLLSGFLKNVLFNSDGTISTETANFFTGNSTDNGGTVTFTIGLPSP